MLLKKLCAICFAVLVAFSCSLLPAVISPAYAADVDQYYMDLYFAPPSIDPIMKSERCPVNSRKSVLAYAWSSNSSFSNAAISVVSSTFEPVDHERFLYLTYGVRSSLSSTVSAKLSDSGKYSNLTYTSNYGNVQYTAADAVFYLSRQKQYDTNARIISFKVTIPANASSLEFRPNVTWSGTSSSATYGIYCESAVLVDASSDVVSLIDDILLQCVDMNTELDTQTQILNSIVSSLGSIDSNVTSIYDLLHTALADESTALDNKSQQVADQIMQQDNAEQYWNDKNQENFNALDLNNFSFSSGVVAALGTVGNLFTSIWNSLGDTVLIFTFPLMLGITLVAIGRVSRHGGKGKDDKGGGSD